MALIALDCFEKLSDGSWICRRDATIAGFLCTAAVRRGQLFEKGSAFAGYDDFTAYLTKIGSARPDRLPHEWAGVSLTHIASAR
jgi:hypothetical protein